MTYTTLRSFRPEVWLLARTPFHESRRNHERFLTPSARLACDLSPQSRTVSAAHPIRSINPGGLRDEAPGKPASLVRLGTLAKASRFPAPATSLVQALSGQGTGGERCDRRPRQPAQGRLE